MHNTFAISDFQWKWSFFTCCDNRPRLIYFKNGPSSASLWLFSFFQNLYCRFQRDSNSDRRSRRRARWPHGHHHCPSARLVWSMIQWDFIIGATYRAFETRFYVQKLRNEAGRSPGLVVMGGDSCPEGRGFESQQMVGHFTYICCKNCIVCFKKKQINKKRHIF